MNNNEAIKEIVITCRSVGNFKKNWIYFNGNYNTNEYVYYDKKVLDLNEYSEVESVRLEETTGINEIIIPSFENSKIKKFEIFRNKDLKNINFEGFNKELTNLIINNNQFLIIDLGKMGFNNFVNLEKLSLRNTKCSGSLFTLRELGYLIELDVVNTDITPSFEYLPELTRVSALPSSRSFKVKECEINKFLTRKNNLLLGDNLGDRENWIDISIFKEFFNEIVGNVSDINKLYVNYLNSNLALEKKEIKQSLNEKLEKTYDFYSKNLTDIKHYCLFEN